MKKIPLLLLVLWTGYGCRAQYNEQEPSKVSITYHLDSERSTTPPYSLEKIQALIAKTRDVPDKDNEDVGKRALSEKTYSSLSLREKFTYNMIHGESFFQSCDIFMPSIDEEKKIVGRLPKVFIEQGWSERQNKFFMDNKDSVISLMRESIGRAHYVGVNYKNVIVDINATEMIPFLIDFYKLQRKDHDILTILLLLMLKNKYPPFMASPSYKKLYANEEGTYNAHLVCNTANQDLIIQRATDFYNGLNK